MLKNLTFQLRDLEYAAGSEKGFTAFIPFDHKKWLCQGKDVDIYLEWSQIYNEQSLPVLSPYFSVDIKNEGRHTVWELDRLRVYYMDMAESMADLTRTIRLSGQEFHQLQNGILLRRLLNAKNMEQEENTIPLLITGTEKARFMANLLEHETDGDLVFYKPSGSLNDKPRVSPEGRFNLHVKWTQVDNGWKPHFEASNHLVDYRGDQSMLREMAKKFDHLANILDVFDQIDLHLTDEEMTLWCEELSQGTVLGETELESEQSL